ncbi:MAG: beta strand repeat-containing protein [Pleurocapsa sp.]
MTNTNNFSTNTNPFDNQVLGDVITPNIAEEDVSSSLDTISKGSFSDPLSQQLEPIPKVNTTYDLLDLGEMENAEIFTGSTSDETIFVDPEPLEGDADNNRHLNIDDVRAIFADRNTNAIGDNDVRDIDKDGRITVLDGRKLLVIIRGNKDKASPDLNFGLENDTAANNSTNNDFITSDPTISGVIEDFSQVTSLTARFDGASNEDFTEAISVLNEDGSFILNKTQLEAINGSPLTDGEHTLYLQAKDKWGNETELIGVNFVLDTTAPQIDVPSLIENPQINSDSQLTGTVNEELASLSYSFGGQETITVGVDGLEFSQSFDLTNLEEGSNTLTITATDLAGNVTTQTLDVEISLGVDDTTPPEIEAVLVNDTGSSNSDFITTDPTIMGIVNDESEIASLSAGFDDTLADITTTLQSDGSFSLSEEILKEINGNNPLVDGDYTLNLVAIDVAGNQSSTSVSFVLDVTEPLLNAGLVTDSGNNSEDGLTNNPTIAGSVTDVSGISTFSASLGGSEVDISDLIDADGNFNLDIAKLQEINNGKALADGAYTLNLKTTDTAGNESSPTVNFVLDTTAPLLNADLVADTGIDDEDNLTNNPTVSGNVSNVDGIATLQGSLGDASVDITNLIDENGNFTLDRDALATINNDNALEDGEYTLDLVAIDNAGNQSTTAVDFILDTIAPELGINQPLAASNLADNNQLAGTVDEDLVSLVYRFNDGEEIEVELTDNTFAQALNLIGLPEGANSLTLIATDKAGNNTEETITVNLDTTPDDTTAPIINAGLAIDTGSSTEDNITSNPTISGTVIDDTAIASLKANIGSIDLDITGLIATDGSFTLDEDTLAVINNDDSLVDGEYTLNLTATDEAGNESIGSVSFTLDTANPLLSAELVTDTGIDSDDNLTSDPTISGSVSDGNAISSLSASFGSIDLDITDLIATDGSFSLDTDKLAEINDGNALADGTYSLNLTSSDEAGNESVSSVSFTLDTTAPDVTISEPLANSNLADNNQLTGTVDEDLVSLVYRFNNGDDVAGDLTDSSFNQPLDLAGLADGQYSLTLVATDKAGNVTEETITVNLDTTPDDTTVPIINLGLVTDTGSSNQDVITSNPTISGTVTDESAIASLTASLGNTNIDIKDLVDADGNFTLDADKLAEINDGNALEDGNYTLNIIAIDEFGNESTTNIAIALDTSQPLLNADLADDSGFDCGDGLTNNQQISGRVTDFQIATLTASLGNTNIDITNLIDADGNFVLSEAKLAEINGNALADGEYTLNLIANDVAGNESLTDVSFILDRTAPDVTINEPLPSSNLADNNQLTGTVDEDLASLVYQFNNEEVELELINGEFTQALDLTGLADGQYSLTLVATDKAGNITEETIVVNLDTTPDDVTAPVINAGLIFDTGSNGIDGITFDPEIFGNITDESEITTLAASLDGVNFTDVTDLLIYNGTSFSLDNDALASLNNETPLADGEYNLELIATDAAGNESDITTVNFILDTIAPELVVDEPADASLLTIGSELSGTVDEELSIFSYHFNDGQDIDIELNEDGTFVQTFDLAGLPEGENELIITAIDLAGNLSEETFIVQVVFSTIELCQTVRDTISATDTSDVFILNAEVGQRIYFDGLDDNNNFNTFFRLISPSGQVIVSSQNTETNRAPITLTEAGAYQVQVQGNVTETEAYSFRILDVGAATELTLGEVTTGTLADGSSTELFSFTAEAGQQFFLDGQGDFYSGSYVIYNAANDFETSQTFGFDREFTLDEAGTYILAVAGNSSEDNQDYRFNLIASDINTQFLTLGEIVTDELEQAGEEDIYIFSGSVGQRLLFDGIDGDTRIDASLTSPSGINIFSFQNVNGDDTTPVTLTEDGVYRLKIDSNSGTTGDYSFRVLDLVSADELTLGEPISSTLANADSMDLYSFTAEAGQKFFLDGQGTRFNGTYTIYNAGNQAIVSQSFGLDREFTIDNTGTYILASRGNSDTDLTYSFNLIPHESTTETLVFGETITGEITPVGDDDLYSFTGCVGQKIYYDGLSNDAGSFAYLISPSGQSTYLTSTQSDRAPITLTEAGTYQIQIDNSGDSTGDYSFRVLDLANATDLTLGTTTTGTLANLNSTDLFSFTAEAGQKFFLDGQGTTFNGTYTIYNQVNQAIVSRTFGFDGEFTAENAGTYILAARGSNNTDLTYSFNLIPQESTTEALVFGETITGEIAPAGDEDLYSFTGSIGQKIYFDGLTNDASSFAYLISPSGQRTSLTSTQSDRAPITLTEAGTYQIQIDNSGDSTGGYSFRVLDLANATDLTLGDITTGTLGDANSTDLYKFTAEAGQRFFLDGLSSTAFNGSYVVYDVANQAVTGASFTYFGYNSEFTIENAGTYILAARGAGDSDVTYSFNLIAHEVATAETLTFSDAVTGNISVAGEQDFYTFTGEVGQRIYFDGISGDNAIDAHLITPSGQEIFNNHNVDSDRDPITLTESGTYQIRIDAIVGNNTPSGDTTEEYSFRILDVNNAQLVELNASDNVRGTVAAGNTNVYRFEAQAGQTIQLTGVGSESNSSFWVYNPANSYLGAVNFTSNDEYEIATNGTYFIYAPNSTDKAINYEFNLTQTAFEEPDPTVGTPLTLGAVVSETISVSGEEDIYTFTGSVGQTLYFDGISSSSTIYAYLISPSGQSTYLSHLSDDDAPITLTEAGIYQVQIDGNLSATGDYSFRLLDAANATELVLDTEIISTLDASLGTNLFTFNAEAGQRFYLDETSDPGNDVYFTIYNSANQYVTGTSSDVEFTLDNAGTYLIAAEGYSGQAVGHEFSFSLNTPETTTQELTLGNIVSNNIGEPGEEDIYTFTGSVGQTLYFDGISSDSFVIYTRLISPSGQNVFNSNFYRVRGDVPPVTLTEAGTYEIEIDGNGETTGDYSFRLLDAVDATAIVLDTEISSTLPIANTSNLFTFEAQASDRFYFDELSDPDSDVRYDIYNSANQYVTGTSSDVEFTIDNAGTYLLVAEGNSSAAADYSFSFNLATPEINNQELTLGNVVSSSISEPGEEDIYTFTGSVGQILYFDGISSDSSVIYTRLISPSGQNVFNSNFYRVSGDVPPVTLTEAGTYQIEIDGNGETTGDYSFRLLDAVDATAITPDTEISSTLPIANTSNLFSFEAQAGDLFYFDELSDPDSDVSYDIYNSANQYVTGTSSDVEFTIDNTGTYLLVAQGNSSAVEDYSFSFNLATPETTTQELILGNVVSSSIGEPGEEDIYTFEGAVGQTIYFDGISGSSSIDARLVSPSGQILYSFQNVNNDDDSPVTLTEAGTYQLEIDGSGITTGDYSFRLLDTASATELVLDTPTTGALDASLGTNLYSFNVAEDGQKFYFDELSDPNNDVYFTIYNSANQNVSGGSSDREFTLDNAGTYLIAAEGYSGQTVDHEFSFNLITPEITTQELNLGNVVAGNISEPGEEDIYTFEGEVGQTIYFDGISGDFSIDARLVSPSGNDVFTFQNVNGDRAPVTLAEAGIYRLEIDAVTETIGDYQFRVLDVEQAPLLNFDTSITGSLTARNSQVFKFEGTSGQTLSFSELGSTSGGIYRIYDDANQLILNRGFSGSVTDVTLELPSDGTYTLVLFSNSNNSLDYNFQVG